MLKLGNVQWQFIEYLNGRISNAPLYGCKLTICLEDDFSALYVYNLQKN